MRVHHRKLIVGAAAAMLLLVLAGCAQEQDIIGLQRPVYTEEESVVTVHFFAEQAEAERYYNAIDAEAYFLFTSPFGNAQSVFDDLEGEPAHGGGKRLRFTANEEASAIDQVVELIDKNGLSRF